MKLNKKYLVLRIITFPIKLFFQVSWSILIGIFTSFNWLMHGGEEIYYGKDNGKSLLEIAQQNKELIKLLNKKL